MQVDRLKSHRRIKRVSHSDPTTGIIQHADAGYESAIACAHKNNLKLPMIVS
jgi:urocanate hydratase